MAVDPRECPPEGGFYTFLSQNILRLLSSWGRGGAQLTDLESQGFLACTWCNKIMLTPAYSNLSPLEKREVQVNKKQVG